MMIISLMDWVLMKIWPTFSTRLSASPTSSDRENLFTAWIKTFLLQLMADILYISRLDGAVEFGTMVII